MELEASAQQRAAAAGAPVPHILAADNSAAALGNPYLICNAIAGETIVGGFIAPSTATRCRTHRLLDAVRAGAGRDPPRRPGRARPGADRAARPSGATGSTRWATPQRRSSGRFGGWPPTGRRRHRRVLVHGDFRMGNLIVDDSRPGRACSTGSSCTSARSTRTWPGSASGRGGSAHRASLGAGGLGSVESFLRRLRGGLRHRPRPRCVPLVADGGHAALGRHLPVPGRAPPVGPDARRSNSPRSAAASAKPSGTCWTCWRRTRDVTSLHGRPTAAELVAAVADFLDTDVRNATDGQVELPRPRRRQRAAHRRARTA